jgi:hypothetical protein
MMNKEQCEEVMNMPGPGFVSPIVAYLAAAKRAIFSTARSSESRAVAWLSTQRLDGAKLQ